MKVFFDTGAFIALQNPKDSNHAPAASKLNLLRRERHHLLTSNAVLYETITWLAVKMGPRIAEAFGKGIWEKSPDLRILALTREDELATLAVLAKFSQIPLSFVDASSVHLFTKLSLDRVFGFDRHFVQANVPLL